MKSLPAGGALQRRFAPTALMFGNIVTGTSVFAPAAMLPELSSGLDVTVRGAGLLITFGAMVLCIGSPLTAWLTSRIERRMLLGGTLAVLALANAASAFAPDFASLLIIPSWEHEKITDLMTAALQANIVYFKDVAGAFLGSPVTVHQYKLSRKNAYVALANLSAFLSTATIILTHAGSTSPTRNHRFHRRPPTQRIKNT